MTRWQFFWMKYFNPRSLTGSDAKAVMDIYTEEIFQSTLPHRERRTSDKGRPGYSYFNPRSLTGSDPAHFPEAEDPVHFNPRSLTGSDPINLEPEIQQWISIHAPSPGATCLCHPEYNIRVISIHAPSPGATAKSPNFSSISLSLFTQLYRFHPHNTIPFLQTPS